MPLYKSIIIILLLTLFYIGFLSHNNICIYIYKYHNKSYLLFQKIIKIECLHR